jgi:enoyl-CoA hydratase
MSTVMTAPAVVLQRQGAIARIVLNRPQARNEIDAKGATALRDACQTAIEDDGITVVVLTGAGQVFCADDGTPPAGGPEALERLRVADVLASIPKPVIAALNGDAMGHGLELALACDLRIAAEDARLGLGHVSRGAIPWDGGTQRLPRLAGRGLALEMVLTGRTLTAAEAQRAGLVTRAVPRAAFEGEVQALAEKLAAAAPIAARYAKEAVRDGMDLPLARGLRLEADLAILLHTTADRAEGIGSFLKKTTPRFTGR